MELAMEKSAIMKANHILPANKTLAFSSFFMHPPSDLAFFLWSNVTSS
jgi:hypothetical protein